MFETLTAIIFDNRAAIVGVFSAIIGFCLIVDILIIFSNMARSYFAKQVYEIKNAAVMLLAGIGFSGLGIEEMIQFIAAEVENGFISTLMQIGTGALLTGAGFIIYGIQGQKKVKANKLKSDS